MPITPALANAPDVREPRAAPLSLTPDEFRRAGHELVDAVAAMLEALPRRPLTHDEAPDAVRAAIDAARPLPESGADVRPLLADTVRLLSDYSLFNGHPRFFGYITSSPSPIGILSDFLAAAVNPNVGAWRLSPVASEIEAQAIRWIADLIGYPRDCSGLFVSGGNMANMVALFTARVAAANWDVRVRGVADADARPLRVYASSETHTWIQKAADLSGIGTDSIRWIPTDSQLRMDTHALRAALERDRAAGDRALMVIGTAGSVSTGAIDPLFELADICQQFETWFHVDGAYGAFAAALPDAPHDLGAIGVADSIAIDPHKWLYTPLEAGCVLVRDAQKMRAAFAYHPPYYHFNQEVTNFVEYGPQNSRGFRALKVWLSLQQVGRSGYVRMIGDDIRLSEQLYRNVSAHEELEAYTQSLSITTFRYVPPDLRDTSGTPAGEQYLDRLNRELLDRIQGSGEAFVSNAVIDGRYLLRACIVNFNTGTADVDALPQIVTRLGRAVDAELR